MATNSKIEWTDHTFNPWRGCSKVHTGCANCYAEAQAKRNPGTLGIWGPNGSRVVASEAMWKEPLKWNKQAECIRSFDCANGDHSDACPQKVRDRVFCASMADVFEDWQGEIRNAKGEIVHRCRAGHFVALDAVYVHGAECQSGCNRAAHPLTLDDVRRRLFELIDATPNLDWLLLTKRPENVWRMWPRIFVLGNRCVACGSRRGELHAPHCVGNVRHNVQIGTSVSDQPTADKAIPELLTCRDLSPVLFLSAEPLLGPIEFSDVSRRSDAVKMLGKRALHGIDWVIVGGESGHHARPCDAEWIRSIRDQCQAAGVPCFVKQLGARSYYSSDIDEDCQFTSYEQWVGKAGSWLGGVSGGGVRYKKPENVVCVDAAGRQCLRGEGFMRARDEGTFPVRWHQVIEYVDPKGGDWNEWPEDLRVRQFPEAVTA